MYLQMIKTYGFVYMMMKTVQLETWFSKCLNLHFLLGQYLVTLHMYVSQISDNKKKCNNANWNYTKSTMCQGLKRGQAIKLIAEKVEQDYQHRTVRWIFSSVQVCLSILWGRRKLWWALRLWLQDACWEFRSRAEANWRIAVWTVIKDLVLKTTVAPVESSAAAGAPAKTCSAPTVRRGMVVHSIGRTNLMLKCKSICF